MTTRTPITTRDAHLIAGIMAANANTEVGEINGPVNATPGASGPPIALRDTRARGEMGGCEDLDQYTVYAPDPDGDVNQSDAMPAARMSIAKFLEVGPRRGQYLLGVPDRHGRGLSPFESCPRTDVSEGPASRGKTERVYRPVFASDLDKAGDTSILEELFGDDCVDSKRHLFFNAAYCYTNCHYDTDWNAYLCAREAVTAWLSRVRKSKMDRGSSRPASKYTDFTFFSDFCRFITVDLNPGDVFIVPPRWWHVVEGSLPRDGTPRLSAGINWFFTYDYEETYRTSPGDVLNLLGFSSATRADCLASAVEMMKAPPVAGCAADILEMAQTLAGRMSKRAAETETGILRQLLTLAVGYSIAGGDQVVPAAVEDALRKLAAAAIELSEVLPIEDSRKRKRLADDGRGQAAWLSFGCTTQW
ncbi:hypothetical protein FOZ60_013826 [Perkinsus olseni]|uniref:JmjC domain-containing protein n=2 Tax=Perkinsus olseni TaxID=32597 RepID=A0A7J6P7Z3_PEROL|nr:hypothetical protein FOZ60_013826 [Perkinsus olseni]